MVVALVNRKTPFLCILRSTLFIFCSEPICAFLWSQLLFPSIFTSRPTAHSSAGGWTRAQLLVCFAYWTSTRTQIPKHVVKNWCFRRQTNNQIFSKKTQNTVLHDGLHRLGAYVGKAVAYRTKKHPLFHCRSCTPASQEPSSKGCPQPCISSCGLTMTCSEARHAPGRNQPRRLCHSENENRRSIHTPTETASTLKQGIVSKRSMWLIWRCSSSTAMASGTMEGHA